MPNLGPLRRDAGKPAGAITGYRCVRCREDLDRAIAYVAGPPGFVASIGSILESLHLPKDRIVGEAFIGY